MVKSRHRLNLSVIKKTGRTASGHHCGHGSSGQP